jgi:hypothetical protein
MLMLVLLVEGQTALTLECNRGRLTPPLQMGLVLPVGRRPQHSAPLQLHLHPLPFLAKPLRPQHSASRTTRRPPTGDSGYSLSSHYP